MERQSKGWARTIVNVLALAALWASGPLLSAGAANSPENPAKRQDVATAADVVQAKATKRRRHFHENGFCELELLRR